MAAINYQQIILRRKALLAAVQSRLNNNRDLRNLGLTINSKGNSHFLTYNGEDLAGVAEQIDAPSGAVILKPFYLAARPINKPITQITITEETADVDILRQIDALIIAVLRPAGLVR